MNQDPDHLPNNKLLSRGPWLIALAVLALVARVAAVVILSDRHTAYYEYMLIARNLLSGLGYSFDDDGGMPMQPTSLFPPGYVYWCVAFMWISPHNYLPLYLAQAAVGASGVFPAYMAGNGFWGRPAGLGFAAAYAIFPEMIVLTVRPVPEWLYVVVFLWLLVLYLSFRSKLPAAGIPFGLAAVFGVVAGLGMLIKATVLLQVVAVFLALLLLMRRRLAVLVRQTWPVALTMLVILAPWVVRNYRVQHRWIPLRTGIGQSLWIGNNAVSEGSLWTADGRKVRFALLAESDFHSHMPDDEQDRDDYYLSHALSFVRDNPWEYARLCVNRLAYFLWFDPNHPLARNAVYRVSYVFLLAIAAVGTFLSLRRRRLDPVLPLTYLLYLLFYVPVLSAPRYRIIPVLLLLLVASYAAVSLYDRWRERRVLSISRTQIGHHK